MNLTNKRTNFELIFAYLISYSPFYLTVVLTNTSSSVHLYRYS